MKLPTEWTWCHTYSCTIGWAYDWQTLLAGLLALIAAGLALKISSDQLKEDRRRFSLERSGRLRAARASLPTALSEICAYASDAGKALNNGWPVAARLYAGDAAIGTKYPIQVELASFPDGAVAVLDRIVELSDDEPVRNRIESVLREAQVFSARTRELRFGAEHDLRYLAQCILEAAAIYARADTLFEFARGRSKTIDRSDLWDRVYSALNIMTIFTPVVIEEAARQRQLGYAPGEADDTFRTLAIAEQPSAIDQS